MALANKHSSAPLGQNFVLCTALTRIASGVFHRTRCLSVLEFSRESPCATRAVSLQPAGFSLHTKICSGNLGEESNNHHVSIKRFIHSYSWGDMLAAIPLGREHAPALEASCTQVGSYRVFGGLGRFQGEFRGTCHGRGGSDGMIRRLREIREDFLMGPILRYVATLIYRSHTALCVSIPHRINLQ